MSEPILTVSRSSSTISTALPTPAPARFRAQVFPPRIPGFGRLAGGRSSGESIQRRRSILIFAIFAGTFAFTALRLVRRLDVNRDRQPLIKQALSPGNQRLRVKQFLYDRVSEQIRNGQQAHSLVMRHPAAHRAPRRIVVGPSLTRLHKHA